MKRGSGLRKLQSAIKTLVSSKADVQEIIPGALGTYDSNGNKIINVPGRSQFVYVRVRGQVSEVIEAFNERIGEQWGTPIRLIKDPLAPRFYTVMGRDIGKYQDWADAGLPNHGNQHSFSSDTASGRDITFIYRRQLVQPLLPHPENPTGMTIKVEADYYYDPLTNAYVRFAGGSSPDMSGDLPSTPAFSVFVLVYLDYATNTILTLRGSEFSSSTPPDTAIASIPALPPSTGIPLAGALLNFDTTSVNWDSIYDVRTMIFSLTTTVATPIELFDHYTDVGNGTTVETDLYTDTLVANQFLNNGDKVDAEYGGLFVSHATATRELKVYFAGTVILDTGALTTALTTPTWKINVFLIRVSATVIRYAVDLETNGLTTRTYTNVGELTGLTLSGANILKITGQAGGVGAASNDIVAKLGNVRYRPAA